MSSMISRLLQDEQGATAIEYGLICALLALAIMSALHSFADSTLTMWMYVSSEALDAQVGSVES